MFENTSDVLYGMGLFYSILIGLVVLFYAINISLAISGIIGNIVTLNNSSKGLNLQPDELKKKAITGLSCCGGGLVALFLPYIGIVGFIAIIVGLVFTVKGMKTDAYDRAISRYFVLPTAIAIIISGITFILISLFFTGYINYSINSIDQDLPSSYDTQYEMDYSYPYGTQYYYQY